MRAACPGQAGTRAGSTADADRPAQAAQLRPPRVAAVVLAAGRSVRMGGRNKLICGVGGIPLVRRAVDAACASRACRVVVVTGHQAELVEATLAGRPIAIAHNADYPTGMASSLRRGLRALPEDIDAAIVMLADMPRIDTAVVDRLIAGFDPAAPTVLVPEYLGRRGNPVLWPRRFFDEMMTVRGDTGARGLLARHADQVKTIPFDSAAILLDIDTPEDLGPGAQS